MIIKNTSELLSHGNYQSRNLCIELIETALHSVDLFKETKRNIRIRNNFLIAAGKKYDLSKLDRIFVVGGGKATFAIAKALDEKLQNRITNGIVSVKKGEKRRLDHINIIESGHPVPDKNSLEAASAICNLTSDSTDRDLFICGITGGASSLMVAPCDGISLSDKIMVNELLLKSGAPINAINSVRNHLSKIKGGNLARLIHPAKILNLIAIDEIEGLPWGPTVPDRTTFDDSVSVLKKYNLWKKMPNSVRTYLSIGLKNKKPETPKDRDLKDTEIQNIVLASNEKMLDAVHARAKKLGLNAAILSSKIEGESSEAGKVFGSIAAEVGSRGRPFKPPCVLIAGGETTVKIDNGKGKGGPSQEFVLGAALEICNSKKIAVASIDTDGTDGPTEVAGGICDNLTVGRIAKLNEDIISTLNRHYSYQLLRKLEDTIVTGATETNVMDLDLAVVLR